MINAEELRLGNFILYKNNGRITTVRCGFEHFGLMEAGKSNDIFPVMLKPELLQKCGFIENKEYALYPEAREFILALPVIGSNKNEIFAYVKSNKECFARAHVNGAVASNNVFHLHGLQNLFFALVGKELEVKP
jgi:hypothetical protein